jgi:CubicO group peptidase (beta-lactamase class C family)
MTRLCTVALLSSFLALGSARLIEANEQVLGPQIDALFAEHNSWDRPGLAIAVVKDGQLLYARGYGCANLEYDIPITPSTIFHVASVSKQFTCFAVVLLAEEGKLSLDDDVRKHVPEVPDFGKTITLRHLMNHTSGVRDQWTLLAIAGWRLDDVITRDHILKMMRRQHDLNFTPGAEYSYSNMGYTLLAEVVANVSGQSFREFTSERIFKPLGMTHTHFHDSHEEIVPNRAYSYEKDGDHFHNAVLSYANVGATSLFTTVEDLSRWLTNLDTGAVGGSHLLTEMHTPGVLNDGKKIDYALGLTIGTYRGQKIVGHSGSDAGYRTHVVRFPQEKLGIVVLSNLGSVNATQAAFGIADVVLADKLEAKPTPSPDKAPADAAELSAEALRRFVGTYLLSDGGMTEVRLDGKKLVAQLPGGPAMEMIPQSDQEFLVKEMQAQVVFTLADDAKSALSFVASLGEAKLEGKRVDDSRAVDLAALAGKYYSDELDTTYELVARGEKLFMVHQRQPDVELTHAGGDTFGGAAWYLQKVEFQRDEQGQVVGLLASSNRVRNVKFERR